MLENLIKLGKALETEATQSLDATFFHSVNFEVWVSKSILYLEKYHKGSLITERVKVQYKEIDSNTNYVFYQFLLGSLHDINELESE